jgi:amino acid transporter
MSDGGDRSPGPDVHGDDEIVASFGYRQQLRRTLGLFSLFAVSFSVISITTGIYTNFQFAITNFGPASIWLWIPAVIGQLLVAFVLAELGSRIPLAGGSYQWAGRLVGPGLGWFVAIGVLMAFTVASGGEVLVVIAPLIATVLGLDVNNAVLIIGLAVLVLLIAGAVNVISVLVTARLNNLSVFFELVGTVVLGGVLLVAFLLHPIHGLDYLANTGDQHGRPVWYGAVLALLLGVFTITGFETCAGLGEEGLNVRRNIPRGVIGSVVISGVLGMVTLICVALTIPDLQKAAASPAPIAYIAMYWLGPVVSRLFLVAVVYSVFALIVVSIAAVARLIFALSRDRLLPASSTLARVNERSQTPVPAIVVTTVLIVLVMVLAALKGDAFAILIASTPVLVFMNNLIIVVAYWRRRDRLSKLPTGFDLGRWATPVFMLSTIWLVGTLLDLTLPPDFRPAAVTAIAIWIVAIAWYLLFIRGRVRRGEAATELLTIGEESPAAPVPQPGGGSTAV